MLKAKHSIFFIIAIVISYFLYINYHFYKTPLLPASAAVPDSIKIYPGGNSLGQLSMQLEKKQLWPNRYTLMLLLATHGLSKELHFGEYAIPPGMTLHQLLKNISLSRGLVFYDFRIEEGAPLKKVLNELKQSDFIFQTKTSFPVADFEGMLYPDTYRFVWGVNDVDVIQHAHQHMLAVLATIWNARDPSVALTSADQLVIVASMIETEAAHLNERPLVAAVIYNRLQKNMRLQIDPTVMYGLGLPYGSSLTRKQLQTDTPYNTYRINGLPPTPIAMPSLTSMQAAAHPAKTDALYYVADGTGGHVFSDNYSDHQKAVARYRALMLQRGVAS